MKSNINITTVKKGGKRDGSGRKAKFAGYKMKTIRVPAALETEIFEFIDRLITSRNQKK